MKIRNNKLIYLISSILVLLGIGAGYSINILITKGEDKQIELKISPNSIELSPNQIPALINNDRGEIVEYENIPTVESVDGGQFKDIETGLSYDGKYHDLGWSETYNTSSPNAFKDDTLGKCIVANNYYGAQCVSLARVFWWSYADRDVSTCGTGLAKGMMNCWEENAGDDFEVIWDRNQIQAGTWVVTGGSYTGHVAMALGSINNGYVTVLGENQGGTPCEEGGSATNIINLSMKDFIGGYTPKDYLPKPEPDPEPIPISGCTDWHVEYGDTMSKIMLDCENTVQYGEAMDNYAKTWWSLIYNKGKSVYDGWYNSTNGVGLYAGDDLEHRIK